jgi:4-hydroxythreonine-4-phosphate dehydrogenase
MQRKQCKRGDFLYRQWRPAVRLRGISRSTSCSSFSASLTKGKSALAVWRFALTNSRKALELARDGLADAVAFTPFNKHAMRLFEPSCVDEIEIIGAELGGGPGREFNVLDHLSNARITSHVPLSKVASLITRQSVLNGLILTDRCMREVGFPQPHIAVAALNPHAGDGGISVMRTMPRSCPRSPAPRRAAFSAKGRSRPTPWSCPQSAAIST